MASAHRGGPGPGLPENALETLAAGFAAGVRLFEVDVRRTKDGVLVLLHDETLERTTTGSGSLRSHSLQELAGVRLKDDAGALTQGRLPTLADALTWAVKRGAYLQLDIKPEVRFEDVVAAVWQARAADSVILIVYSTQAASRLARLAPDMTISAPAETAQDLTALQNAGVGLGRLAAWTGLTEKPLRTMRRCAVRVSSRFLARSVGPACVWTIATQQTATCPSTPRASRTAWRSSPAIARRPLRRRSMLLTVARVPALWWHRNRGCAHRPER
nr:glycerophosphodiester phosphodiesterase family protein [Hankyongella ginsenosidimutans]